MSGTYVVDGLLSATDYLGGSGTFKTIYLWTLSDGTHDASTVTGKITGDEAHTVATATVTDGRFKGYTIPAEMRDPDPATSHGKCKAPGGLAQKSSTGTVTFVAP